MRTFVGSSSPRYVSQLAAVAPRYTRAASGVRQPPAPLSGCGCGGLGADNMMYNTDIVYGDPQEGGWWTDEEEGKASSTAGWGTCSYQGKQGNCVDKIKTSCSGSWIAGLCPGGTNIQCCLPTKVTTTQPVTPAKPATPATPGSKTPPAVVPAQKSSSGLLLGVGIIAAAYYLSKKKKR